MIGIEQKVHRDQSQQPMWVPQSAPGIGTVGSAVSMLVVSARKTGRRSCRRVLCCVAPYAKSGAAVTW